MAKETVAKEITKKNFLEAVAALNKAKVLESPLKIEDDCSAKAAVESFMDAVDTVPKAKDPDIKGLISDTYNDLADGAGISDWAPAKKAPAKKAAEKKAPAKKAAEKKAPAKKEEAEKKGLSPMMTVTKATVDNPNIDLEGAKKKLVAAGLELADKSIYPRIGEIRQCLRMLNDIGALTATYIKDNAEFFKGKE